MSDDKVDLNQATAANLTALPGIGKALARRIVEYREEAGSFGAVADLAEVPGISDQMVSDLEAHLTVQAREVEAAPQAEEVEVEAPADKKARRSEGKQRDAEELSQEFEAAAREGDIKKVQTLMKDGADGQDKFALIWAAEDGNNQVVAELIKAGADVNSKTAVGGTNALALAAQNGHLEVVRTLIEAGADVNEPAIEGWTPLMKAAFFGHEGIAQTLLEAGAEPGARDANGKTAIDHAKRAGNQQIVGLLSR